jgi:tripartite-type tricarboxylate transporter receptor subunit TctC
MKMTLPISTRVTTKRKIGISVAAALTLGALGMASADAQTPAEFYKGKNVTITVAGGAGASLGLYCRLVAQYWSKHIPGNPNVICQFRPGAGGTKAAAYMYNAAPKDGTYVGEVLAPSVLAPALRKMKFDATKFIWLGSVTPRPGVITVWHTAPATTLEGAKKVELVMGSTGKGSETFLLPQFMNVVLGTKFKIVRGYKAALINNAMPRGEVHGRMNYWSGWTTIKQAWIRDKKIVQLVQIGPRIAALPNVPSLIDLMPNDDYRRMVKFFEVSENLGMGFYLPPGVPNDRVEALRASFINMLRDPAFLADAKKRNADVNPISGAEIQKIVESGLSTPEPILAKLRTILGFKKN